MAFFQNEVLIGCLSLLRLDLGNGCEKPLLILKFHPLGISKPEEGQPTVSVTGNDITAPPNKELPPSPEKKTKVVARMVGYLLPLQFFLNSIFSYYCLNRE